eukprot:3568952-Pyramimonas_sp.AAC.1
MTCPKKANWSSLLALDQGIEAAWGEGLEKFVPKKPLRALPPGATRSFVRTEKLPRALQAASFGRPWRALVQEGSGPKKFEGHWAGRRCILHTNLDQGSIGWPSRTLLFSTVGLRGHRWLDPCHRHANNLTDSLTSSGLGVIKSEGLVVVNAPCGPWNEAANYDKAQGAVLEYMDSTKDDDGGLFIVLYPFISWDLHSGKLPANYGSDDHREWVRGRIRKFVQEGMGTVVELNRWFQLWQRVRPMLPLWSLNLYTKLVQCLQKGYYEHFSELALFAEDRPAALGAGGLPLNVAGVVVRGRGDRRWGSPPLGATVGRPSPGVAVRFRPFSAFRPLGAVSGPRLGPGAVSKKTIADRNTAPWPSRRSCPPPAVSNRPWNIPL